MSEENVTTQETVTPVVAPVVPVAAPLAPAAAVAVQKIQMKDFLIPASIVIAGICIAGGMYLSGGTFGAAKAPANKVAQAGDVVPTADTTSKVNPVTAADHIKGNLSAPIKIVEYSDFECPFCKRGHETMQGIVDKLGPEKVAWVFRQFPLEQLHKKALPVAMASECVAELGGNDAFWKFTDGYFAQTLSNDKTDIETLIPKLVTSTGVDKAKFTDCFTNNKRQADIAEDSADAVETGGRGTPWAIIIGPSGKTYPVNGAQPAAVIEQQIETALSEG